MNLDRRLLGEARRAQTSLVVTVSLGALAGVVLVAQARFLSRVVDRAFLRGATLREVQSLLVLLLILSLVRAALVWGSEVSAQRVAEQVKAALRERLFAHLLALGPTYARDERSGELTNTVVEGIEALDAYLSQYLPQLAMAVLVPVMIVAVVMVRDTLSAVIMLLTAPLIPFFMVLIGDMANRATKRQWTALSRMSAHFLDVLQGLTTLKLLGRSREQLATIAEISDRFRRTTLGVLRVAFLSALVLEMLATISTAVVAVAIGLRLLYGRIAFEQAFFVLLLMPEFYLPLRLLGSRFHASTTGVAAARRIFEILETQPLVLRPPRAEPMPPPRRMDIRLLDVHCAYDAGRRPALRGVSFHVSPGQKVALVGPSGAGKSTVVHLLLRFIDPDEGYVLVDGRPLADLDIAAWRSRVAWVPQRPYLFHASVAENIRLARPQASMAEVVRAARLAHADAFINDLPRGYDTVIGERGTRLSGGQAQRIALARAFLKDAPLLILDEVTSNLDPEHEALVQEAIRRLMAGRTVIIVAHRLSMVYDADQILVMAGGRIVQAGTHQSLLHQGGLYQQLVAAYGGAG